jgi:plasmid stabilization system protein ParE
MVKLEDPTVPFAGVIARRRRERAATDALAFRLGTPGRDWQAIYSEPGVKAVVGATDRALDTDHAEHTLQVIGAMGGLLTDLGFQVCPASALTAGTIRPSLLAWVVAGGTPGDELRALGTPCIVIGPCPAAPADWACIDASEFDKRDQFIRRFVAAVSRLVDLPDAGNVSNNLSNELRRTGTDDDGRVPAETAADLHEHGRRRITPDVPAAHPSDS